MRLDLLPKGIDDLYSAIFAKILPEDLHHAINYLEALSKSTGLITLHDMSFIDEGPQVALDRPFASIPTEERTERCRKMKGRIMRCTRNLLEFREINSEIQDGYRISRKPNMLSDNEEPDNEEFEDRFRSVKHVDGVLRDEGANLVSHEGQFTNSLVDPSTSPSVHEPLLQMEVRFVHRTLQEYMNRATLWEPIVERAIKNMLIDPHLSMLACTFSKIKTCPSDWSMPRNRSMSRKIAVLSRYIRESEYSNITHFRFLESMFTGFKNRFSNWTEYWDFPANWGCGVPCVLARFKFHLHLREAFEQKRVDSRYLPHLLPHYFMSDMSYHTIRGPELFQLLLRNGCRVVDQFKGRSAWEVLLWKTCRILDFNYARGELEVCRMSLENGADPNLLIQPLTVDHLPLDLRSDVEVDNQVKKYKWPCYPLHMIIAPGISSAQSLLARFQTIKKFLECGARLDAENRDGETILENASNWRLFLSGSKKRHWNFAPILLRLQMECQIASRSKLDLVPDPVPQDTILDSFDIPERMLALKLKGLLAKLEEEGYGYVSKNANVSRFTSDESDGPDDSDDDSDDDSGDDSGDDS